MGPGDSTKWNLIHTVQGGLHLEFLEVAWRGCRRGGILKRYLTPPFQSQTIERRDSTGFKNLPKTLMLWEEKGWNLVLPREEICLLGKDFKLFNRPEPSSVIAQ